MKVKFTGLLVLLAAIVYVVLPNDCDTNWWGYIDDFFVFLAGYTFFVGNRNKVLAIKRRLYMISGSLFIIGMMSLIALILFS